MLVYTLRSRPLTSADVSNPWQPPGDGNYTFDSIWSDPSEQSPFVTVFGDAQVSVSGSNLDVQDCLNYCEGLNPQWQYAGLESGKYVSAIPLLSVLLTLLIANAGAGTALAQEAAQI
jgi:hypothetical protein